MNRRRLAAKLPGTTSLETVSKLRGTVPRPELGSRQELSKRKALLPPRGRRSSGCARASSSGRSARRAPEELVIERLRARRSRVQSRGRRDHREKNRAHDAGPFLAQRQRVDALRHFADRIFATTFIAFVSIADTDLIRGVGDVEKPAVGRESRPVAARRSERVGSLRSGRTTCPSSFSPEASRRRRVGEHAGDPERLVVRATAMPWEGVSLRPRPSRNRWAGRETGPAPLPCAA